ncbi:DUF4404 family protein [Prosthecobacter sp.]|uniref:DUF4404 family protein n=1 Tax=Prosthecobacter sp. TaxID=1965333 RepID=UPI001D2C21C3|nr:DUF4404 family protein [Prosthecobacter sp.]MCB1276459.1 DUF4404 family protein [Prosthecobacter sp.]
MTTEQLEQLKTMVENAGDLPEAAKTKLLELLDQTPTDSDVASEAPQDAQGQWMSSIGELEAAHPEATGFMNRLATTLANMGI